MKIADVAVKPDEKYSPLDLEKVFEKKILRVEGHVSREYGEPVFQLTRIEFTDGTSALCEGEHDMPYLTVDDGKVNANMEELAEKKTAERGMKLVRYGVVKAVIGEKPIVEPLSDGYWTPWHIAEAVVEIYRDKLAHVRQAAGQPDDDDTEEGTWVSIYMEKLRANLQLANTMRVMRKQKTNALVAAAEQVIAAWDVSQDGDVATHLIHDLRKAVTSIKEKK